MKEDDLVAHIGQRLKQRRNKLGLSQEEVGNGIGVASQQVQKYEKGTNVMNVVRLYQFAVFLKVPITFFFQDFNGNALSTEGVSYKNRGVEEDAMEYDDGGKTVSERETLEVLKSFKRIKDYALRKRVADLLRTLSLKDV